MQSTASSATRVTLCLLTLLLIAAAPCFSKASSEDLKLSGEAIEAERWEEAVPPTLRAAEAGNATSQFNLGNLYARGLGVKQSWEEARKWWRRAADAGDATSNFNLALAILTGQGGSPDAEAAEPFLKCAAFLGDAKAQVHLALRIGPPSLSKKSAEELSWFWRAAVGGNEPGGAGLRWYATSHSEAEFRALLDEASLLFLSSECPRASNGTCDPSVRGSGKVNANAHPLRMLVHRMITATLSLQGLVGHAGDGGTRDSRGVLDVLALHRSGLPEAWRPLMRLAVSNRLNVDSKEAVRLDVSQFWELLQPGDSVLLSDRVTHHYSTIYGVDRVGRQVFLVDFWPERFFALHDPDYRRQGVELVPIGCAKRLVRMPRKIFEELALSFSGIRDRDWPPK